MVKSKKVNKAATNRSIIKELLGKVLLILTYLASQIAAKLQKNGEVLDGGHIYQALTTAAVCSYLKN